MKKINKQKNTFGIISLMVVVLTMTLFANSAMALSRSQAESVVRSAYQACLGRSPESAGLKHHVDIIMAGKKSSEVYQDICKSQEAQNYKNSSKTVSSTPPSTTSTRPPTPSCPFPAGTDRYIVNFGTSLRADNTEARSRHLVNANIPSGKYDIKIMTWDPHSHHSGQGQNKEQVVLKMLGTDGSVIHTTNRSSDIPDNQDSIISIISTNATFSSNVNRVLAYHPEYPSSNPQSLTPICAVFEKVAPTPPTPSHLDVSCSVSNRNLKPGQSTAFTANVSGGTGSYTYRWFGDVSDTRRTFSQRFNNIGSYRAHVEVTDGSGVRKTATCPVVVVEEDVLAFDIQCNISRSTINVGERVNIDVDIYGGRSPYYIDWSGDARLINGFNLTRQNQSIRINRAGTYRLRVDVEDRHGNRSTDTCIIRVRDDVRSSISVSSTTTTLPPSGDLAGLSSIYLSQVPYTGPEDVLKVVGFVSLILIWSSAVAYYFLKDRKKKLVSDKVQSFKEANRARLRI